MSEWNTLFAVTGGAAATLTGLLFVGISINLTKILSIATLPERGLISITLLLTILMLSVLNLIPKQSYTALGTEIIIISVMVWIMVIKMDMQNRKGVEKQYKKHFIWNFVLDQLAVATYLASGITIVQWGEAGLYVLVAGISYSFIKALIDAWVLLVEINR